MRKRREGWSASHGTYAERGAKRQPQPHYSQEGVCRTKAAGTVSSALPPDRATTLSGVFGNYISQLMLSPSIINLL
jgi:hypothetical protein